MGCGSSTVGVANENNEENNGNLTKVQNGHTKTFMDETVENKKKNDKTTDKNANIQSEGSEIVPKSVAFEVAFNDKLLLRNPPRRLQKLDPLNIPKLTPEMLAEKQKIAEEKRERERQRKVSASRKSSKRRRDLMKAREFDQQQAVQSQSSQIDEQLKLAEMKRQAKLEEVRTRQRLKEERAKRAREKARKLNQEEPEYDIEVEKDDNYNNSDDSWLGDYEDQNDGYGSPKKKPHRKFHTTASASTVDSYDNAFMRDNRQNKTDPDDFFDS